MYMLIFSTVLYKFLFLVWQDGSSPEVRSADALVRKLLICMESRLRKTKYDTVDLIIVGVEASLWVAEKFAADMRVGLPEVLFNVLHFGVQN